MFKVIDLANAPTQPTVRVAICQIPLTRHQFAGPGSPLAVEPLAALEARIQRTLDELKPYQPQIVQFPECTIPASILPLLRKWSTENNCIVIAGTHYEETPHGYLSKCPILFPDGKEYACEKTTISPLEKSPVPGKGVVPGSNRYIFRNSAVGNFLVMICADLLAPDAAATIAELDPDIVFVSAFQPDRNRYHPVLASLCINSKNGLYACYSNCVYPDGADGHSGLFAVTDKAYLPAFREAGLSDLGPEQKLWEAQEDRDFAVCNLDLKARKPVVPKSALASPNAQIVATHASATRRTSTTIIPPRLVAFDMDGTLLRGIKFSWTELWEACGDKNGKLWRGHLKSYLGGKLSYDAWCDKAVTFFKAARLDKDKIFNIAQKNTRLTKNFAEGMETLRAAGLKTALISGGVDTFLSALIPDHKKHFDNIFVNRLLFDGDGVVSGVQPTAFDFEGKARALKQACDTYGFDLSESIFVGDRFNDRYAIDAAGHSIHYSDAKDAVEYQVDHVIDTDDFLLLSNYILARMGGTRPTT